MHRSRIELHNVDCLPFMKQCEDNQFDLAIVDPPYGIKDLIIKGGETNKKMKFQKNIEKWDITPKEEYWNELFRISKNQIIWGANYFTKYLPISRGWVFWDKNFGKVTFAAGELAFTSFNTNLKIWKKQPVDKNRIHPTQKPVELYRYLLNEYAEEGNKIFDSHLGSGSIAIACDDLGYDLTACEIDKDYFEKANKRLEPYRKQQTLF